MLFDAGEDEKESSFVNDGYAEVSEDEVAEELAHLVGVEEEEVEPLPIIEVQHPANLPCPWHGPRGCATSGATGAATTTALRRGSTST